MSGTVDSIHRDAEMPSFTLNIPQYFSVIGKDARPVLPLRCVLPKSKKWKDPAALLPFPRSTVACAGVFSHYETESRNGRTQARLVVNLDVIEYLAKPSERSTSSSPPSKFLICYCGYSSSASHVFHIEVNDSLLSKSRYAKKTAAASCSPSPKALGKRRERDEDDHSEEPAANRPKVSTAESA